MREDSSAPNIVPIFADDSVVRDMLLRLDQLERQTDPQHPDSEYDKDASPNKALRIVSELCVYFSGWAMDHKIGLAIEGFGYIPDLATQTRTAAYKELRNSVNSHRHEAAGQSSPRGSLCDPLAEGLQALEYGETLPIFDAIKGGRKRQFRELRLQLWMGDTSAGTQPTRLRGPRS